MEQRAPHHRHTHIHTHTPTQPHRLPGYSFVNIPQIQRGTTNFITFIKTVVHYSLPCGSMYTPGTVGMINRTRVAQYPSTPSTRASAPPACSPFVPRDHDVITWVARYCHQPLDSLAKPSRVSKNWRRVFLIF